MTEITSPNASQDCDLVSPLPRMIYEKYQRDGVCFGLYNAREIADGVFVHVQRSKVLKTVKISGMGELELTLDDDFLRSALETINKNAEITVDAQSQDPVGVNLMPDWNSFGPGLRMVLTAQCIARCLHKQRISDLHYIYGIPTSLSSVKDTDLVLSRAKSILAEKPQNESVSEFVKSKNDNDWKAMHLLDMDIHYAFRQFAPALVFSNAFQETGKPIKSGENLDSSLALKLLRTAPHIPVMLNQANDQEVIARLKEFRKTLGNATNRQVEAVQNRPLQVTLAEFGDTVASVPETGPLALWTYLRRLQHKVASAGDLSTDVARASCKVLDETCSLLGVQCRQ